MSFNRQSSDESAYKYAINQSVDAARYAIQTPRPDCSACFPYDPSIAHGQRGFPVSRDRHSMGVGTCAKKDFIDVDSEMRRLNRPSSKCPAEKYLPNGEYCGSILDVNPCKTISTEATRISNAPCNLRCTGWNRFEWLCKNPQDKSLIPFDYGISSRTVVKDNHRPCIEDPMNQAPLLPPANRSDAMYSEQNNCKCGELPTFTCSTWRTCDELAPFVK